MKKKIISLVLTGLLVLSCCTAGLSALALDDAGLQAIYDTLSSADRDETEADHNYDDCIALIKDLTSDELIALGKLDRYYDEAAAFWWAGDKLLKLNRSYSFADNASGIRAYCPSVYQDIAAKVPAYADFISVLLDGITAYSFLVGEPTAADIALSAEERTPFAIGKRMAALPEEQASALKSSRVFGSSKLFSVAGITENVSRAKAEDESIGAIKESLFGLWDYWTSVFYTEENDDVIQNFYIAACYFEKTYTEAAPNLAALENFSNVIENLQAPYRTADVEAAKAAYAAIPTTAWGLADDRAKEARVKYRAIVRAAGLEDNAVDLSAYKQTDLGSNELSDKSVAEIKELLGGTEDMDKKLSEAVFGLATGQTLVTLLGKLAGANEMLSGLFSISMARQGLEKDPKFAGAVQKMEALQAEGHWDGFFEYGPDEEGFRVVTWSCADQFTSADFGFADGDFYGFADALGGCLGGLSNILAAVNVFSLKNKTEGDNYVIGKYEDVIPLFELLDLPTPSSAAFTEAEEAMTFTDAEGNAYENIVRAGVNCLLKPVADYLMTTFKAAPTESLIDLLPKIAYAIESGLLNDTVQKLASSFASLSSSFGISGLEVDLSKDAVWAIVDKKLVSGYEETSIDGTKTRHIDGGIDMDKDGQKEPVPLTKARFDRLVTELAGCAEPAVKPSVSIPNANRLGLNTQKNKVVSVAVAEILEMEKTEDGKTFLNKVLDALGAPSLAKSLLNFSATHGTGFTFKLLNRFLPIVTIVAAVLSFFQKVKAIFSR